MVQKSEKKPRPRNDAGRKRSGASGGHKHPIMALRYPKDRQDRWRDAAARAGKTLADWVGEACDAKAGR